MEFQGFQSGISIWVTILLLVLAFFISWKSYQQHNIISSSSRWLLISLRSLAFALIIVLLFNPFFKGLNTIQINPKVLVLIDNSRSVAFSKGDYDGINSAQKAIEDIGLSRGGIDFEIFSFESEISPKSIDSLDFEGSETDIFNAVQKIKDAELDANAAIILSDGIFTLGRNPVFSASDIGIPIYSVILGDTSSVVDIIVKDIDSSPTGYVNTTHSVEAQIQNFGFANASVTVEFRSSQELIDSKTIIFNDNESVQSVSFEVELTEEGLTQYEVRVTPLDGEWSAENNSKSFTIDVLDSKIQILYAAFEIHPDVGAIRNILEQDQNIDLINKTWISGSRFIEQGSFPSPDSLELIIIHGLPRNPATLSLVEGISATVPVVYIQTPRSVIIGGNETYQDITLLSSQSRPDEVGFYPALPSDQHPILELPTIDYTSLTSIIASFRNVSNPAITTSLFNVLYRRLQTNQSVIAVSESGNRRLVHVNAFGWHKIHQSSSSSEREFVTSLFNNIVSWASSKPDDRKLKISPAQRVFDATELITLDAYLENESGEIENDAKIDVTITDSEASSRTFTMENSGNGNYSLSIPSSIEGAYSFSAEAKKGNRIIDTQNGEFLVNPSNSELVNTIRDDELLQSLSSQTGGEYVNYTEASTVIESMNNNGLLNREQITNEVFSFPVQKPLWFIIVIVLLSAEWLIRKYFSLP